MANTRRRDALPGRVAGVPICSKTKCPCDDPICQFSGCGRLGILLGECPQCGLYMDWGGVCKDCGTWIEDGGVCEACDLDDRHGVEYEDYPL